MIGDIKKQIGEEELSRIRPNEAHVSRVKINLLDLPIEDGDKPSFTGLVRMTKFEYYLRFKPQPAGYNKGEFVLVCDLFIEGKARIKSYEEIVEKAKTVAEFAFILRNTNLSEKTFFYATQNLNVPIPVVFDIEKYDKAVRKKLPKGDKRISVFFEPYYAEQEREKFKRFLLKARKELPKTWN